jgi:hypothetical protein
MIYITLDFALKQLEILDSPRILTERPGRLNRKTCFLPRDLGALKDFDVNTLNYRDSLNHVSLLPL